MSSRLSTPLHSSHSSQPHQPHSPSPTPAGVDYSTGSLGQQLATLEQRFGPLLGPSAAGTEAAQQAAAAGVAARFLQARVSCVGGSCCEGGT